MFLKIYSPYVDCLEVEHYDYLGIVNLPEQHYREFVQNNLYHGIKSNTTIDYFYQSYQDLLDWAKTAKSGDYLNRGDVWVCVRKD